MGVAHVGLVHCDPCKCKVKGFRAVSSIERNVSNKGTCKGCDRSGYEPNSFNCCCTSALISVGIQSVSTPFSAVAIGGDSRSETGSERLSSDSEIPLFLLGRFLGFRTLDTLLLVELRVATLWTDSSTGIGSSTLGFHLSGISIPAVVP